MYTFNILRYNLKKSVMKGPLFNKKYIINGYSDHCEIDNYNVCSRYTFLWLTKFLTPGFMMTIN